MTFHLQTHHGKATGGRQHWKYSTPSREPRVYKIAFPTAGVPRNCPVEGCQGWAAMWTAMRVHFFHQHVQDIVIILEEGALPYPRCPWCDMLVPWQVLNKRHLTTAQCAKGAEINCQRMAKEEMWESAERSFQDYGRPLQTVTSFKYLGRVLTTVDKKWSTLVGNLRKARKSWARLTRLTGWEGFNPRLLEIFLRRWSRR